MSIRLSKLCEYFNYYKEKKIQINGVERSLSELVTLLEPECGDNGDFTVEHQATLLKLMLLARYLTFPYLKVMDNEKSRYSSKYAGAQVIYFDPFAGSGVTCSSLGNDALPVPGSAIATVLLNYAEGMNYKPGVIDKFIFVDIENSNTKRLYKRLIKLKELFNIQMKVKLLKLNNEDEIEAVSNLNGSSDYKKAKVEIRSFLDDKDSNVLIVTGSANIVTHAFVDAVFERDKSRKVWLHTLSFVDPSGPFQYFHSSLSKLLQLPGDIIMLVHPELTNPLIRKWKSHEDWESLKKRVALAFGISENDVEELVKRGEYKDFYINMIRKLIEEETKISWLEKRRKMLPVPLTIDARNGTHYYIVLGIRKDAEKFINYVNELAGELESLSKVNINEFVFKLLKGDESYVTIYGRLKDLCLRQKLDYYFTQP